MTTTTANKVADDAKFLTIVKMMSEFCEEMGKTLVKVSDWQKNSR